jgi:hypothetical protein
MWSYLSFYITEFAECTCADFKQNGMLKKTSDSVKIKQSDVQTEFQGDHKCWQVQLRRAGAAFWTLTPDILPGIIHIEHVSPRRYKYERLGGGGLHVTRVSWQTSGWVTFWVAENESSLLMIYRRNIARDIYNICDRTELKRYLRRALIPNSASKYSE